MDVDVPKQARPMVVAGPHAEATVLGTEFTLSAGAGYTRLDVREGRVRFSRGVSSVVVTGGQWGMSTPGQDLAVKTTTSPWKAPPAGLLGWFKADQVKPGVKGAAASWLDQSGAGRHAVQPGPVSQPQVVDVGRPALRFDGADDFLELPGVISDFRGGLSAFVVARIAPGTAPMRIFDFGAEISCDNIVFGRKDGNLAFWALVKAESRGRVDAPLAGPEQWAIYSVVAQSTAPDHTHAGERREHVLRFDVVAFGHMAHRLIERCRYAQRRAEQERCRAEQLAAVLAQAIAIVIDAQADLAVLCCGRHGVLPVAYRRSSRTGTAAHRAR